MELREFAERVLFAGTLQDKLVTPPEITDDQPGQPIIAPATPGRPAALRFKSQHTGKRNIPGVHDLARENERGRLLHFFANHELLATELMALVLLRFPNAPPAFRRAVLQTLKDEQEHTRWYLHRMQQCGIAFGELPVSGYFWRAVSTMESPLDYVAGLSLTFEQANLDFARFYARGFAQAGDNESSLLLQRIYRDEIGHVACGLKWFRKWKDPGKSDWDAFRGCLNFPLSAQRAKGPDFNIEGRLAAGLDKQFIEELNVFAQSKGRTPTVFLFNPFAEGRIAHGQSFAPNKHQKMLQDDLENLPQFLGRQDDVVLVQHRPSISFLSGLKEAGFVVPEFVELQQGAIDQESTLKTRKVGALRPWAWGPDSLELLSPLLSNVTRGSTKPADYYTEKRADLYSKSWSASVLKKVLSRCSDLFGEIKENARNWICTEAEAGVVASAMDEAESQIEAIRQRGHHKIVVKEALGVAGHNAIRLLEPELLESQRRWMTRSFENGRDLVIEPWLDRVADFSVQLEMEPAGLKLIGYAGLRNDWRGQYEGNFAWPGFKRHVCADLQGLFPHVTGISRRISSFYEELFRLLEEELRPFSYLGPVGIDSFVYRTDAGELRLKPIVEINPRYTMGRLTLELMHNVAPGSTGTFRLINRQRIKRDGFGDFAAWAYAFCERVPLEREGQPVPKIRTGALCLNDPARAQVCLAVFEVTRTERPSNI